MENDTLLRPGWLATRTNRLGQLCGKGPARKGWPTECEPGTAIAEGRLSFRKLGVNSHNVCLYSVRLSCRLLFRPGSFLTVAERIRPANPTEYNLTLCELIPSLRNANSPLQLPRQGAFRGPAFPRGSLSAELTQAIRAGRKPSWPQNQVWFWVQLVTTGMTVSGCSIVSARCLYCE